MTSSSSLGKLSEIVSRAEAVSPHSRSDSPVSELGSDSSFSGRGIHLVQRELQCIHGENPSTMQAEDNLHRWNHQTLSSSLSTSPTTHHARPQAVLHQ